MSKIIYIKTTEEMIDLGFKIGSKLQENTVVTLSGDLGAGKTTLTKGIGRALGISSVINSPTYTILKIYEGVLNLYHMDVYRINENSGDDYLEEYFEMGGVSVIEWASNIEYLLPNEYIEIKIEILENSSRKVIIRSNGEKYKGIVEGIEI